MKAGQISAHMLLRKLKNQRMVIFSVGRDLDSVFPKFHFKKYVDYIVDNNQELWGTDKLLGNMQIPIRSAQYMRSNIGRKTMSVVMIKQYSEVLEQLSRYKKL